MESFIFCAVGLLLNVHSVNPIQSIQKPILKVCSFYLLCPVFFFFCFCFDCLLVCLFVCLKHKTILFCGEQICLQKINQQGIINLVRT